MQLGRMLSSGLVVAAVATVLFGVVPGPLIAIVQEAARALL